MSTYAERISTEIIRVLVKEHGAIIVHQLVDKAERLNNPLALRDSTQIGELPLSNRARGCLIRADVTSVGQLRRRSDDDLLRWVKHMGRHTLREIRAVVPYSPDQEILL